jgi:hypothetical protein
MLRASPGPALGRPSAVRLAGKGPMLTPYHRELGAAIIVADKGLAGTVGRVASATTPNAEAGSNSTTASVSPDPINGHGRNGRN